MHKRPWVILVLTILVTSTLIGCPATAPLTILSISEGNVSVMKAGTASWTEAQEGMSLDVGDSIKTGDDSSAEITFSEGSTVELQADTEIELASLDISTGAGPTTIALEQTIGSVIFRVTKIVDAASRYEVETPTGVVAVRGSIMQVNVVEDGTTWVANLEGDIWASAQGVELQVPQGQQCVIRPGQPPELIIVEFVDPNLEAAIREAIDKATGDVYESDLLGLTSLDATQRDITNLSGIEHCTDLTSLSSGGNQISDISPLANLTNLTSLGLCDNQISDIGPVANLTSLMELDLGGNQVGDVGALANLTNLTWLNLPSNQVSYITSLADLTNLTYLQLGTNRISDITPLANLIELAFLSVVGNQISDISPLGGLRNLTWLSLWANRIDDVSPLVSLTNLTGLELGENQVSDISPLVENEGLSEGDYVDLRLNPLSEESINMYIPQLEERGVKFNPEFPLSEAEPCLLDTAWIKNPDTSDYYALTVPMRWMAAEACAQAWGGHLVTLNDWEEESWVKDVFGQDERFWIGFYVFGREHRVENFIWSSGEPVTYTNWEPGEPNNYAGWENAAVMNWRTDYWNDEGRDVWFRAIIEVSEEPG